MPKPTPAHLKECKIPEFQYLFNPRSIAIVGASKNKIGGSKYLIANQDSGFIDAGGKIYLINPKFEELFGLPVYSTIDSSEIPKPIDLVIIAVRASIVPKIVRQCNHIARFGVIYSSGFGEAGNEELEQELKEAIQEVDTRFVGPNGLGIVSPYNKLSIYPNWENYTGNISYIAQSGGTMARLYLMLGSWGLGFRQVVSIGNAYDIKVTELMQCFQADPQTENIALYLESLPNGREFYKLATQITPHKPIVLWKGGQTDRGVEASFSHTGGLAGSYNVWKAMCKQSGIMLADHFELFMDLVQVASIRPYTPKNLNVAILVAGGGIGVEFTDIFSKHGLNIPDFDQKTIAGLNELFPNVNTNFKNPVDMGEWGYNPVLFSKAFQIVSNDPNIETVVFVREPERFELISKLLGIPDAQAATVKSIEQIAQKTTKPIICNLSMNRDSEKYYQIRHEFKQQLIAIGVPVVDIVKNIPEIIKQLHNYGQFLRKVKKK